MPLIQKIAKNKAKKIVVSKSRSSRKRVGKKIKQELKTEIIEDNIVREENDFTPQKFFKKLNSSQETENLITNKEEMKNAKSKKQNKRLLKINLYRKIAYSFILLTVLLLVVIFYFSFVRLNIILISAQERISNNLIVDIYDKSSQSMVSNRALAGAVEQVAIEETKTYSASGVEIIGEEVIGRVIIINTYNKNQPLVATTRLLSPDNKLFRLKNTINVPAGGSQEVEIYADESISEMAIEPTKFTIPGLWAGLQDKIYGESKAKFVYKKQTKNYIRQSDIDQAIKDLKKVLIQKAEKEIGQTYKGYDKVIYNIDENTISIDVEGKVGEEKDKFDISIKAKVMVIAFSGDQIGKMAQEKLSEIVPDNKKLIGFNAEEIVYNLNNYNINQGLATVNVSFEGKMILKEDADIIDRHKIVNLTREQLEDYLSSFKEIAGYEINFRPSFINKVPNLVDRIKIEIKK